MEFSSSGLSNGTSSSGTPGTALLGWRPHSNGSSGCFCSFAFNVAGLNGCCVVPSIGLSSGSWIPGICCLDCCLAQFISGVSSVGVPSASFGIIVTSSRRSNGCSSSNCSCSGWVPFGYRDQSKLLRLGRLFVGFFGFVFLLGIELKSDTFP